MVGRHEQIHRLRVLALGPDGGGGHGGGGIARLRLQQHDGVASQFLQLLADRLPMRHAADDDQAPIGAGQVGHTLDRFLKRRPIARQGE